MLTIPTPKYPTIGDRLAADLRRARLRRESRPRAKRRPVRRKPKRDSAAEAEAALREIPGMAPVLDAIYRMPEAHTTVELAEYNLKRSESTLSSLRESQQQACHARERATSAAERLEHHREFERLGARVLEAERDVRQASALLTDTRQQLEGAEAGVEMAMRGLVS
jgi:hypothetical protein